MRRTSRSSLVDPSRAEGSESGDLEVRRMHHMCPKGPSYAPRAPNDGCDGPRGHHLWTLLGQRGPKAATSRSVVCIICAPKVHRMHHVPQTMDATDLEVVAC